MAAVQHLLKYDDGHRWFSTQTSCLWLLGVPLCGSGGSGWLGQSVGHHIVHAWDIADVSGVLGYLAELMLLSRKPGIRETAQHLGEWPSVCP